MSKISDYKIAAAIIREACRLKKKPFADMDVVFEGGNPVYGRLYLGQTTSIGQTLYQIVYQYCLVALRDALGSAEEFDNFLIYVATLIRKAVTGAEDRTMGQTDDELFIQHLYQRPFVWSLIHNLVRPIHEVATKNIVLACGTSPHIDIAKYYRAGEVTHPNAPTTEFIFVNDSADNEAVKSAVLFYEALRAHDLSPTDVVRQFFESEMYDKLMGIAKMALIDDDKVEEFIAVLFSITGLSPELFPHVKQQDGRIVMAQGTGLPQTVGLYWWYQGLIEKMLEPVRGPDWSTRQALEGMITEFWDQVELIKSRKRQGDGVPFNDLLRLKQLQTTEPIVPTQTIQHMLSQQRIWQ